jgi:hypothetical protein
MQSTCVTSKESARLPSSFSLFNRLPVDLRLPRIVLLRVEGDATQVSWNFSLVFAKYVGWGDRLQSWRREMAEKLRSLGNLSPMDLRDWAMATRGKGLVPVFMFAERMADVDPEDYDNQDDKEDED